jgi:predicted O-methyltransferase YrrM
MNKQTIGLEQPLYDYLLSVSLRESEILEQLRQETANYPNAIMQIAPEQGQFMALLIRLMQAKRAIEVGVFTGYSSLCVALALPDDGQLIACDISSTDAEVARRYWVKAGVEEKIDFRLGPALVTLDNLIAGGESGKFDFAFIDADKNNYDIYYEKCLQLIRPGGLIAVDNVLWSGRVADLEVTDTRTNTIREFNRKLSLDSRIEISLVPIADGLTLAWKKP